MNKKVIATCQLTNFGGIAILDIIHGIEDKIKFTWHNGEKFGRIHTSIIRNDAKGEPYFNSGKRKYFLSDFIKVK